MFYLQIFLLSHSVRKVHSETVRVKCPHHALGGRCGREDPPRNYISRAFPDDPYTLSDAQDKLWQFDQHSSNLINGMGNAWATIEWVIHGQ